MQSWYRRFTPSFTSLIAPLTHLLRKHVRFRFGEQQEVNWRSIINYLMSVSILSCSNYFDLLCTRMVADMAWAQFQVNSTRIENEWLRRYICRNLTQSERPYFAVERECLAILFSIEKLWLYLPWRDVIYCENGLVLLGVATQSRESFGAIGVMGSAFTTFRFCIQSVI